MRYRGQEHTVTVACPEPLTLKHLLDAFGLAHERAYTFRLDDVAVELVTYQVTATQRTPDISLGAAQFSQTGNERRGESTIVIEAGAVQAAIFSRDTLTLGAAQPGPALIEEPTATTLILPGQRFMLDHSACVFIEEEVVA
jgi:N-methylhydantoinase A